MARKHAHKHDHRKDVSLRLRMQRQAWHALRFGCRDHFDTKDDAREYLDSVRPKSSAPAAEEVRAYFDGLKRASK